MSPLGQEQLLIVMLLFCRIGACLMLMPGLASPRVPVQVRLFIALGVTLAITPLLAPAVKASAGPLTATATLVLVASETAIGLLIGLGSRIFFAALAFIGTAITMFIGFSGTPDPPIDDPEPQPALATLLTLTATLLFFLAGLHVEVIRALIDSYGVLPAGAAFPTDVSLGKISGSLSDAFMLVLQISAPFLVWTLLINFLFGLLNKLTPQIPVYFVSVPFVVAGGLVIAYFAVGEVMRLFINGLALAIWKG